jgi:hypothetical protein
MDSDRVDCSVLYPSAAGVRPFQRRQRVFAELMGIGFIRRNQSAAQLSSSMALDRLPPPALTAYGLQSIIQHIAHFPMGSGTAC